MDAAFRWLMLFIGSQLFIIAIGLLPLHLWRSFRTRGASPMGTTGVGVRAGDPVAP